MRRYDKLSMCECIRKGEERARASASEHRNRSSDRDSSALEKEITIWLVSVHLVVFARKGDSFPAMRAVNFVFFFFLGICEFGTFGTRSAEVREVAKESQGNTRQFLQTKQQPKSRAWKGPSVRGVGSTIFTSEPTIKHVHKGEQEDFRTTTQR